MDPQQFTDRSEYLDENGDFIPPWERFPEYERYTIGWRMGSGEDWIHKWYRFLEDFDPAFEARLAYLKRHPPAPINWSDHVYSALHPTWDDKDDDDEGHAEAARRAELLQMGLIASDIAYQTWLRQQRSVRWPWEFAETPQTAARYFTRDLWFWSRQVRGLRVGTAWRPPEVPAAWQPCAGPLETRQLPALDLRLGLLSLAHMLAAGRVAPPWELGLGVADFADSFEMDMGYVDAFRLWIMSAFDDRDHWLREIRGVPESWGGWVAEQVHLE